MKYLANFFFTYWNGFTLSAAFHYNNRTRKNVFVIQRKINYEQYWPRISKEEINFSFKSESRSLTQWWFPNKYSHFHSYRRMNLSPYSAWNDGRAERKIFYLAAICLVDALDPVEDEGSELFSWHVAIWDATCLKRNISRRI